ncbi:alpha/beta fold hydrolase [Flavilitoribacter nigricans]|uniref:Maspardin n=1 Tax=Flavilitoribacter nigricans (strain ATCC 23147 / DSM 23189 / NBRC 102662 / NCIMB 1420 / SS-2) TaxID=1122177 RepID=A0A2D0NJ55_FLAN2|nr:alpha/beta hydrolase [Flavilitoribacter nigricans]PHN08229.1 alpha/beta hydrolase [Flavilitoribacter nigricans DSM 23189 = NBRC 102662]
MKKYHYALIALLLIGLIIYLIPVQKQTFSELYDEDPGTPQLLAQFREIPVKELEIEGVDWTYLLTGKGDRKLVFLHGMGGAYDIWWQQIENLKYDFQIISITLPEVHSVEEAVAGILAILDAEGIDKSSMVGTSMGGYIAQYFLLTHPDRLNRLVLGNTFPPNHYIAEKNAGMRRTVPFLPEWYLMRKFKENVSQVVVPASGNSALVEAYLHEQYSGYMSKQQFIGRMDVVMDYFEPKYNIVHVDVPKLIIESDNDPLITPELRSELQFLYPEAAVFSFAGQGHFPYLNQPDGYTQTLRRFLYR